MLVLKGIFRRVFLKIEPQEIKENLLRRKKIASKDS